MVFMVVSDFEIIPKQLIVWRFYRAVRTELRRSSAAD